jgi:hypothetical protein
VGQSPLNYLLFIYFVLTQELELVLKLIVLGGYLKLLSGNDNPDQWQEYNSQIVNANFKDRQSKSM